MSGGPPFRDRLLGFLRAHSPGSRDGGPSASASHAAEPGEPAPAGRRARPPTMAGPVLAERRARLASALRKVGAEVHDLVEAADPGRALLDLLRSLRPAGEETEAPPRAALDGDPGWPGVAARLGLPSLAELVGRAGFEAVELSAAGPEPLSVLVGCALGISLADLAVAETGSLAQFSRPWRARSISLLPPAHLVVLPEERIVADLEELFQAAEGELGGGSGYLTLITGPSRTADIEKVLTIGVHGPGRLVVAVAAGGPPAIPGAAEGGSG